MSRETAQATVFPMPLREWTLLFASVRPVPAPQKRGPRHSAVPGVPFSCSKRWMPFCLEEPDTSSPQDPKHDLQ